MTRVPNHTPLRDASLGFGLWPWARGPLWRLEEPHTFSLAVFLIEPAWSHYTIPAGYEFDKASVPPVLWGPPFNYLPDGLCTVPALEHDFLCDLLSGGSAWLQEQLGELPPAPPAAVIHQHFEARLYQWGVRPGKARAMGAAVKRFGPGGTWRPSSWFRN